VVEHCGGLLPSAREVVFGGPMMGMAQKSLEVPILKGTSGILCLDRAAAVPYREFPCIRCGRAQLARVERVEELESHYLMSCFECAACSFACPSRIPLVQWMRMGKAMVKSHKESA
jgi:electron transport complex protein RnfC